MSHGWRAIAKAEFRVSTSRFRRGRLVAFAGAYAFAIVWALLLAPEVVSGLFWMFEVDPNPLIQAGLPGIMRTLLLVLWVMILLYPLSYSLQEIKIGQWEIMLSSNVRTREMLLGMFVGKIPIYFLIALIMAPLFFSVIVSAFSITLLGQALMYLAVFLFVLATIWVSNLLSVGIQAKLGDSPRGNDLAKALSIVVALIFLVPVYGLMYFAGPLTEILGWDIFLVLPSTWCADLLSWIALLSTSLTLPPALMDLYSLILVLPPIAYVILLVAFAVATVVGGFSLSERMFSLESTRGADKVITVKGENAVLRGLRRLMPGSFGTLTVTSIKEFSRKAQNISRVAYGAILAIILPVIFNLSFVGGFGEPIFMLVLSTFMVSMMLGLIAGLTFGGVGFLESKDQLWIIQSGPSGAWKYMKARLLQSFLISIPLALFPAAVVSLIMDLTILDGLLMSLHSYVLMCGCVMIATGITALNPAYEDTKSSAFYVNTLVSMLIIMFLVLGSLILGIRVGAALENIYLLLLTAGMPAILLGGLIAGLGAHRLSAPES
ncbi:hypothetical protein EU538_06130 [Candidatus Thorarchaeota archaeon]|nr:MAG: hypothetical protein EU538_06130 [Candidatus Thorarchaeota archaeon]